MPESSTELRTLAARALERIDELERMLAAAAVEPIAAPIAIIGMGCRFPGAPDLEAYWDVLRRSRNTIEPVPASRWTAQDARALGASENELACVMSAGLVQPPELFDHEFFGISPREAETLDPQQRLLLEVGWEAIEDAGLSIEALRRHTVGTFVGVSGAEYGFELAQGPTAELNAHMATGTAHSVASGRLAYTWGFHGPAVSFDTACSSALVALHYARLSLLSGDCDIAIVGGVSRMLLPHISLQFARAGMLSPSGRCAAFDASADGFVRSEGCGVLVLQRLSDAERDGNYAYATLLSSAANQDGRTSGITVPNGRAQEAVMQRALSIAGLTADRLHYVEAHGTGTRLGDPIELRALARVHAQRDRRDPLLVGSVKTVVGHLEAAAGIAGVMKVALSMERGSIPAQLHLHTPTAEVEWSSMPIEVVTRVRPWPSRDQLPTAGVSSFGFSGTNAHVILQAAPRAANAGPPNEPAPGILCISARSARALATLRSRYLTALATAPSASARGIGWHSSAGRTHFRFRICIVGSSAAEMADRLERRETVEAAAVVRPNIAIVLGAAACAVDDAMLAGLDASLPGCSAQFRRHLAELRHSPAAVQGATEARLNGACLQLTLVEQLIACGVELSAVLGDCTDAIGRAVLPSVRRMLPRLTDPSADAPSGAWLLAKPRPSGANGARCDAVMQLGTWSGQRSALGGTSARWSEHEVSARAESLLQLLAASYEAGAEIRWHQLARPRRLEKVRLPTYAFERKAGLRRHWRSGPEAPPAIELREIRRCAWVGHEAPDGQRTDRAPSPTEVFTLSSASSDAELAMACANRNLIVAVEPDDLAGIARALLRLAQGIIGSRGAVSTVLFVVPYEQQTTVPSRSGSVAAALAKVMRLEHPEIRLSCVHVERVDHPLVTRLALAQRQGAIPTTLFIEGSQILADEIGTPVALTADSPAPGPQLEILSTRNSLQAALERRLEALRSRYAWHAWTELPEDDAPSAASGCIAIVPVQRRALILSINPAALAEEVAALQAQIDRQFERLGERNPSFVLVGRSVDALTGWPGRILDAICGELVFAASQRLRHSGARTLCVDWPMIVAHDERTAERARFEAHGFTAIDAEAAAEALARMTTLEGHFVVLSPVQRNAIGAGGAVDDVLRSIARQASAAVSAAPASSSRLDSAVVRSIIAECLGMSAGKLDEDVALLDYGLDSLLALEIRERLAAAGMSHFSIQDALSGRTLRELLTEIEPPPEASE